MTVDNAAIYAAVPRSGPPLARRPPPVDHCDIKHPTADGEATCRIQATTTPRGRQRACLEIEIVHRRPQGDDVEALSINLQAMPSFDAFGRFLETANPFVFWAQVMQMAWLPWLQATRALTTPWSGAALAPPRPQHSASTDAKER